MLFITHDLDHRPAHRGRGSAVMQGTARSSRRGPDGGRDLSTASAASLHETAAGCRAEGAIRSACRPTEVPIEVLEAEKRLKVWFPIKRGFF